MPVIFKIEFVELLLKAGLSTIIDDILQLLPLINILSILFCVLDFIIGNPIPMIVILFPEISNVFVSWYVFGYK